MSVNGAPIFGPEEGPGGDAVALHFDYFNENRQPIVLGWCTGHSAGPNGYHYHYDANCVYWEPAAGESMDDYDLSKIQNDHIVLLLDGLLMATRFMVCMDTMMTNQH